MIERNYLVSLLADCPVWLPCSEDGRPADSKGNLEDWQIRGGRYVDVAPYAEQFGLRLGINLRRAPELVVVSFILTGLVRKRAERFGEEFSTYSETVGDAANFYFTTIKKVNPAILNLMGVRIMCGEGFVPVSLNPTSNLPPTVVDSAFVNLWMKGDL